MLEWFYSDNLPYAYCEQIGKEIRDVSDEIPFDIPDSCEWVRLGIIKAVENSGISDYVIYTNAKVFPTLINKAS